MFDTVKNYVTTVLQRPCNANNTRRQHAGNTPTHLGLSIAAIRLQKRPQGLPSII